MKRPIMLPCALCLASLLGEKILIVEERPPEVDWKAITAAFDKIPVEYYDPEPYRRAGKPWYSQFDKRKTKKQFRKNG